MSKSNEDRRYKKTILSIEDRKIFLNTDQNTKSVYKRSSYIMASIK